MAENVGGNTGVAHLSMNDILETVHFRDRNKNNINRLSDAVYEHILKELVFPDENNELKIGEKYVRG